MSGGRSSTRLSIRWRGGALFSPMLWLGIAFCLSLLVVWCLTWGAWWPALACGAAGICALQRALPRFEAPAILGPPARLVLARDGNRFFRAGLLACTSAILLLGWAGWEHYAVPYINWALLVFPLALVIGWCGEGWLRGEALRTRVASTGPWFAAHRREIAILALITAADLVLHLWLASQDAFLYGSVHDEAFVALDAWRLAHSGAPWPLYVTMGGSVAMFQPLSWLFLHFTPSMLLLRLYAIPMAVALAPAFYLLARQLTTAPAALCATSLLALAYWPTMMGSLAFGWLNGSVFACLGLALLIQGLRRWSVSACAAAGMVLALCLYGYSTHRLMPILALMTVVIFVVWGPGPVRRRWLLSGSFTLAFLSVAAPWIRLVTAYNFLLKGDAAYMAHYFSDSWHQHPLTALGDAMSNAANLTLALLGRPLNGGYAYMVLPSGGLIDPVTAAIILLGLASACIWWRRPVYLVLLLAIVLPLPSAAIALKEFSEVYRLNGMVPALFLAVALLADRTMWLARDYPRWAMAAVLLPTAWGGIANVGKVTGFVRDDRSMCQLTDVYSSVRAAYIALAGQADALEPTQAVFVVTNSAESQPWNLYVPAWTWLFQQPLPRQALATAGQNPATWPVLANPETPSTRGNGARFWPPRLGPGERGITYFMVDDASNIFLPRLRRTYPGGRIGILRPPQCAATGYRLTSYALTAPQLAGTAR